MAISKVVTSLVAIGMFSVAIAQEEARVKIEVMTDDGDGDAVHMAIDSEDLGFNLHDMQEGENQAIVDDQGRTILVTRQADGFKFEVDGKTIEMPMISGDHDETHEVKIVKKVEVISD
jgi:hypothetical protein